MREIDAATKRAIVSELQSGRKIPAIKLYREATGYDLRTAKNFIEELQSALQREGAFATDSSSQWSANQVRDEVIRLMQRGDKIPAIKVYREHYRVGLKDAKDAVEEIGESIGIAKPKGCGATVLLLALVLAATLAFS